jgi:hypothetical protein
LHVPDKVFEKIGATHIAAFLLNLGYAAQAADRRTTGFGGRQTEAQIGFGFAFQVKA